MPVVKSFAVGNGDMFYIQHGSDSFTIIDCDLNDENESDILAELKKMSKDKGIKRFISTHPDDDHFGRIEVLDEKMPIYNFYVVKNKAIKDDETESFKHYCSLRDGDKAYYLEEGCKRKWLNEKDDERGAAGIQVLWPDTSNEHFAAALKECNEGKSYNNISCVVRYEVADGASFLWLGDLENEFMEKIVDSIELPKTTIVFASHHGRKSGKIPDSWLDKLEPQIIVIGEAPSRHLHYYTGYNKITQNRAGDITMDCVNDKVHFYVSNENYTNDALEDEGQSKYDNYIGSITVEKSSRRDR